MNALSSLSDTLTEVIAGSPASLLLAAPALWCAAVQAAPESGVAWRLDTAAFVERGSWCSLWLPGDRDVVLDRLTVELIAYGRPFNLTDWVVYAGNPVRVAYNELDELRDTSGMEVRIQIEADVDGDGLPDAATSWYALAGGSNILRAGEALENLHGRAFRVRIDLTTGNPEETPLIKCLLLEARPPH